MDIRGDARIIGLFGEPLAASPVPTLVNAAFRALELPYFLAPFRVPEGALREALAAAKTLGLAGLAVAPPHKDAAAALLDELGPTGQVVSSVDTVSVNAGRWTGHNTELRSFLAAFEEEAGVSILGKRALVVGAGGTARSIIAALIRKGAASIAVCNRGPQRLERLLRDFADKFPRFRPAVVPYEPSSFQRALQGADLLINATPSMLETPKGPLAPSRALRPEQVVFDANYLNATPLLTAARAAGCRTLAGSRMLVCQTAQSVKQWTGREPPHSALKEALEGLLTPS